MLHRLPARVLSLRSAGLALLLGVLAMGCSDTPGDAVDMGTADLRPSGLGPDEIPLKVAQRCPGDPGCLDQGDGKLYAGAGRRDISPKVESYTDTNANGIWDEGEPFVDRNGNKAFDAFWMAGFGSGRQAQDTATEKGAVDIGVQTRVFARAIAMRQNQTTVVLVSVDSLGLFRDEAPEIQKLLDKSLEIDRLLIHATHCHETADLVGGWGKNSLTYGVNEEYQRFVRVQIAAAVTEAVRALKPVQVTIGSIPVQEPNGDLTPYVNDVRDPVIIDNTLHTMQFTAVDDMGKRTPVATIVNWAFHPESIGDKNKLISSDFVGYLRDAVEKVTSDTVIYVSGALGGQIGPSGVNAYAPDGTRVSSSGFKKAEAVGTSVARFALNAMADPNAVTVEGAKAKLSFRTTVFPAQVFNTLYHLASMAKIYRRSLCCFDTDQPISETNVPAVETEVTYLQLGPASIITNPGELLPELFLGGYDGKHSGTYKIVDTAQQNAPDLSKAPPPPYLVDIMDGERRHRMTFGLTSDFVGYIVPRYNFVLSKDKPYFEDAPGDHYEETNSIGPLADPQIAGTMRQLILDGRPNVAR